MSKALTASFTCMVLACALHSGVSWARDPTTLRVVGDNNYPPYLFLDADGQPHGYVVDEWRLWEQKTGIKVELTATNWTDAQRRLQDGQADVIEMLFQTPQRDPLYDFTPPYTRVTVSIYADAAITGIHDAASLKGFTVGVESGDACVEHLRDSGITDVRQYTSYAQVIGAATRLDVRIFCMDDYPANYYLYRFGNQHQFTKAFDYYSAQFRRGVRKGDADTLALVQRGMALITDDERAALRRKWMGRPVDFTPYTRLLGYALLAAALAGLTLLLWVRGLRRMVRRRTRELEREQAHWRTLVEDNPDAIWLRDAQGTYLACNPRAAHDLGKPVGEILGRTDAQIFGTDVEPEHRQWDRLVFKSGVPVVREESIRVASTGELRIVEAIRTPVLGAGKAVLAVLGVARDITARKQAEERLAFLAHHDPLTDLPNRRLLVDRLDHAIAQHPDVGLAVMLIDLDNFKHVNESLGHPIGDLLLKLVAERLPGCVPAADTVAHLGGDEFAITLSGYEDLVAVSAAAERVLGAMAQPFAIDGHQLFIGASMGVSVYPDDGEDSVVLLKNADAALYRTKRDGRNACSFYNAALTAQARRLLQLGMSLRRALEQDEFVLVYQPQVHLATGRIIGMEALIRWQSPTEGLVSPADFIPYAEEIGLIEPIGRWVLRTACDQLAQWLADGLSPIRMAVNLSPRQLASVDLVAQVRAALDATGVPPELLELEITEGALMEHGGQATEILEALRRLGVSLAIDDFGTGYSSLAYLRHFPVQLLKIDQSFMRDIPADPGAMEIASAIVAMAHSLHLNVLAEGVETARQAAFLQEIGCDYAQGWYHGRPMPATAMFALLCPGASTDAVTPG